MKPFLWVLWFGIFIPFAGFSNPNDIWKHDQHADQGCYMLSAGMFQGNFDGMNAFMNRSGVTGKFSPFLTTAGVDWVIPVGGRYGEHKGSIGAEFIFPQQLNNDSVKFGMMGWHLISSLWSYDILKENNKLALEVAPGMDWGELYINHSVNNGEASHYHNPFIAPMARLEFRIVLPPFAFGVRAVYRYDISAAHWKSDSKNESIFINSRISGFGFQLFFGWGKLVKDDSKYYK